MTLRWRNLEKSFPGWAAALAQTECCGPKPRAETILAAVPMSDQKRGQPPFRYRCETCGPTQEDIVYAYARGAPEGRVLKADRSLEES